jgi:hypothetical protein
MEVDSNFGEDNCRVLRRDRRRIIVLRFGPRGSCATRKRDRLPDRNAPRKTSLVTPSWNIDFQC